MMKMVLVVCAVLVVFPLSSCTTLAPSGNENVVSVKHKVFTPENMERAITFIKGLQTSISIVGPLACAGVSMFQPGALPACNAAMAGHQAIAAVTDQLVEAYEKEPTPENAQAVLNSIGVLEQAWSELDKQYKSKSVVK